MKFRNVHLRFDKGTHYTKTLNIKIANYNKKEEEGKKIEQKNVWFYSEQWVANCALYTQVTCDIKIVSLINCEHSFSLVRSIPIEFFMGFNAKRTE